MTLTPARLFTSCGGLGYLPVAPGTWGSAGGAVAYWYVLRPLPIAAQLSVAVVVCVLGAAATTRVEQTLGIADPGEVVIDEVVGLWITALGTSSVWGLLAAFGFFRLFDIWKPWPARTIDERVPGGWGVMLDDVVAGAYGLVVVTLLGWVGAW